MIKILRVTFNVQQTFEQNVYFSQNSCASILFCSVCVARMRAAALVQASPKTDMFAWLDFVTFTDENTSAVNGNTVCKTNQGKTRPFVLSSSKTSGFVQLNIAGDDTHEARHKWLLLQEK